MSLCLPFSVGATLFQSNHICQIPRWIYVTKERDTSSDEATEIRTNCPILMQRMPLVEQMFRIDRAMSIEVVGTVAGGHEHEPTMNLARLGILFAH